MIVDCHTHIWNSPDQLGKGAQAYLRRQGGEEGISGLPADHRLAAQCVSRTLVLGTRCRRTGALVPNDFIARHVANSEGTMLGVAAVDPADLDAPAEAAELLDRKEFCGLTLSPAMQDFHPTDSRAMRIYEIAAGRGKPVFFAQATHFPSGGRMEYARPSLLDEVAGEFPSMPMVLASLGHPWVEEGIAMLGKHANVFADIAALIRRPWQAYNSLVLAHQFNVMDKIFFGSDFPFCTAADAISGLYRLQEVTQGTNLPTVPREALRSIVERPALVVLGIEKASPDAPASSEDDEL
ncbi:MAG: amidohydrolase family protein [Phycisphaerae bacterium]|jgi:hypothetical protein